MRYLITLLTQINSENMIAPGWKSHIIITKKLPKFFPCKILCNYKVEYHISFIAELLLNHINNNLDLILSISPNILSKIAYQTMKTSFLLW